MESIAFAKGVIGFALFTPMLAEPKENDDTDESRNGLIAISKESGQSSFDFGNRLS